VCRWKPLPLSLTWGCQRLVNQVSVVLRKRAKKQREVGTNHNGWEGSNWEVPGGGGRRSAVVRWYTDDRFTGNCVTGQEEGAAPQRSPALFFFIARERHTHTHANTHAHSRTHFLFLTLLSSSRDSRFEEEFVAASQVCLYCDAIKLLSAN
jgi:hypothetical protein